MIGEVHTDENEGSTKEEIKRNLLWEYRPGEKDGCNGVEIDVVGSDDGS